VAARDETHPNVGFVEQLIEYGRRLRAPKSARQRTTQQRQRSVKTSR